MDPWSNIEIPADDLEINAINEMETGLGDIPIPVREVRELITRFEICHFKYRRHLQTIVEAIRELKTRVDPEHIGAGHFRHGGDAINKDSTGRSKTGRLYVWALQKWLGDDLSLEDKVELIDLHRRVARWLGKKTVQKEHLVLLLVARLTWNWESYHKLVGKTDHEDLEYQVCRMDICHYDFPSNLQQVIKGIGQLRAVGQFEGCGSYHSGIRKAIEKEFQDLNRELKLHFQIKQPAKTKIFRSWLMACLAKTIKEQAGLKHPIEVFKAIKSKAR
jgi:hypothetical protein